MGKARAGFLNTALEEFIKPPPALAYGTHYHMKPILRKTASKPSPHPSAVSPPPIQAAGTEGRPWTSSQSCSWRPTRVSISRQSYTANYPGASGVFTARDNDMHCRGREWREHTRGQGRGGKAIFQNIGRQLDAPYLPRMTAVTEDVAALRGVFRATLLTMSGQLQEQSPNTVEGPMKRSFHLNS